MEVRKRRSRAESLSTSAWSVQGCWANLRQVVQEPASQNWRDATNLGKTQLSSRYK